MKSLLVVISLVIVVWQANGQAQSNQSFEMNGYRISIKTEEMLSPTKECDNYLNRFTIELDKEKIFEENICASYDGDVKIRVKGYVTVVEHYSSPVGWTIYYLVDLCKGELIVTKRIDESDENVTIDDLTLISPKIRHQYTEKLISF